MTSSIKPSSSLRHLTGRVVHVPACVWLRSIQPLFTYLPAGQDRIEEHHPLTIF